MKITRYIFLLILFLFYQASCKAQNALHNYFIEDRNESIKDFGKRMKKDIGFLKDLNPNIKDTIKKGDTIYIAPDLSKKESLPDADVQVLGKSGLFKEVNFLDKRYFVFEVDPHKYKIDLYNLIQSDGEPYSFSSIAKDKKKDLLFAMNGGMYEQDLTPVGLYIAEGKTYKSINLGKEGNGNFYRLKPNGVFMIDSNDNAKVLPSDIYVSSKLKPVLATQSGPMLLVHGVYNSNFQPNSTNFNIRNGVGINKKNNVVFVISEDPVSFYEFSQCFKEFLGCDNALYLDGVVSQIFVPELQKSPSPGTQLGVFITVSNKTGAKKTNNITPGKNGNDNKSAKPPKDQEKKPVDPTRKDPQGNN